jgi:hypothetical protein
MQLNSSGHPLLSWLRPDEAIERATEAAMKERVKIAPGDVFGRLTVEGVARERSADRHLLIDCVCECGRRATIPAPCLRDGRSQSCGCLMREVNRQRATRHGYVGTRTYRIWQQMKTRCLNPNHWGYVWYGAKGITVCSRWAEDFAAFLADMGECPPDMSLDRIDGDRGYEPGNCRWASRTTQNNNRGQFNLRVTLDGVTRTLSEWCRIRGINYGTARYRLMLGMLPEEILSTELKQPGPKPRPRP